MNIQEQLCKKYGAKYVLCENDMISGVADNISSGEMPINGLRHPISSNSSGWFFWAGEQLSDAEDFFKPTHISHVIKKQPEIEGLLGLAPGWRFLIDPTKDYVDVWFDKSLLNV